MSTALITPQSLSKKNGFYPIDNVKYDWETQTTIFPDSGNNDELLNSGGSRDTAFGTDTGTATTCNQVFSDDEDQDN